MQLRDNGDNEELRELVQLVQDYDWDLDEAIFLSMESLPGTPPDIVDSDGCGCVSEEEGIVSVPSKICC